MRPEPAGGKIRCEATMERELRARGFRFVAGVDEVGRGSLFGPVVAAAVILSPDNPIRGLNDSKLLDAGAPGSARRAHPGACRRMGRRRGGCRHHRLHQHLPGVAGGDADGGEPPGAGARIFCWWTPSRSIFPCPSAR